MLFRTLKLKLLLSTRLLCPSSTSTLIAWIPEAVRILSINIHQQSSFCQTIDSLFPLQSDEVALSGLNRIYCQTLRSWLFTNLWGHAQRWQSRPRVLRACLRRRAGHVVRRPVVWRSSSRVASNREGDNFIPTETVHPVYFQKNSAAPFASRSPSCEEPGSAHEQTCKISREELPHPFK